MLCELFLDVGPLLYQQDQVFTQPLTIIDPPEMGNNKNNNFLKQLNRSRLNQPLLDNSPSFSNVRSTIPKLNCLVIILALIFKAEENLITSAKIKKPKLGDVVKWPQVSDFNVEKSRVCA